MTNTRREVLQMLGAIPFSTLAPGNVTSSATEGRAISTVRDLFPQLASRVNGHPLIYLDNAATTLRPLPVLDAMMEFYRSRNANPARDLHSLATHAFWEYEHARSVVARFINAGDPLEIIWTRGTTEALNLFFSAWAVPRLRAGDEIVTTISEHASCMLPLQIGAGKTGATIRYVDVDEEGRLRLEAFDRVLSARTKLVCFTHVSNVLGAINPAKEICRRVKQIGARVLIDAAQSIPHFPIDVQELGCDFAAFSSHKMLGPMGAGALYARREAMEEMTVYQAGSNMAHAHALTEWEFSNGAQRFGAGTPSVADMLGFAAAAELIQRLDHIALWSREQQLTAYALQRLHSVPGLRVLGPPNADDRISVFTFVIEGVPVNNIVRELDSHGICIRAGDLAAMPLLQRFHVQAAARASLNFYNNEVEIDHLVSTLVQLTGSIRRGS